MYPKLYLFLVRSEATKSSTGTGKLKGGPVCTGANKCLYLHNPVPTLSWRHTPFWPNNLYFESICSSKNLYLLAIAGAQLELEISLEATREQTNTSERYGKKIWQGSPFDCRPFTAEAPPIGKILPFIKIAVNLEPVIQFGCPLRVRVS